MMVEKILFICTHNSARSQMAEGLVNHLLKGKYHAYSAGTEPTGVNSYATKVMEEIGIDISSHRSKSIDEFRETKFDYVITVCDNAKEVCPFFPGGKQIHKSFVDPSTSQGTDEEILSSFRKVRDEIKEWIMDTSGF
ncbi:MAG: arsenate reductase ArsC [Halobacteriota archaeon]|nr:arsenate reductase ArsC [Halobacteriota archaeon]